MCFAVALVYMDRLMRADRSLAITPLSVHRLLLSTLLTAAKVHCAPLPPHPPLACHSGCRG